MPWSVGSQVDQSDDFLGGAGTTSTIKTGLSIVVAAGDAMVVFTTVGADPTTLTSSFIDNLGNSYVRRSAAQGGQLYSVGDDQGWDVFTSIITVPGTITTLTYTPGGTQQWVGFAAVPITGSDAASSIRASQGAIRVNPGTGTDGITTPSISANSGDLLVGFCAGGSVRTTLVAGTGFTGLTQGPVTGMRIEYKTASGSGAATFTDGTSGGATSYGIIGIALTPASGGGNNTQTPTGLSSTMQLGTPTVVRVSNPTLHPTGLAATMALGTPSLSLSQVLKPTGFSAPLSLGTPSVSTGSNPTIHPTGFSAPYSLGTFTIQQDTTLTGIAGFSAPMSLGTPSVSKTSNPTVQPTGLSAIMQLGIPSVQKTGSPTITPAGFSATMTLGSPTLVRVSNPTVAPAGLAALMQLGTPTLQRVSNPTVTPLGLASLMALGTPTTQQTGSPTITPNGLAALMALGLPRLLTSTITIGARPLRVKPLSLSTSVRPR